MFLRLYSGFSFGVHTVTEVLQRLAAVLLLIGLAHSAAVMADAISLPALITNMQKHYQQGQSEKAYALALEYRSEYEGDAAFDHVVEAVDYRLNCRLSGGLQHGNENGQ